MLFLTFLLLFVVGYLGLSLFNTQLSVLEKVFYGYFLSISGVTLCMFYLSVLGGSFNAFVVFSGLVFVLILECIAIKICKKEKKVYATGKELFHELTDWWTEEQGLGKYIYMMFLVFIIIVLGGSMAKSLYFPVSLWDALTAFDYSGRLFAKIPNIYTAAEGSIEGIQNYPLFTALSHTLVYLLGGENPHFTYFLLYVGLAVTFYKLLIQYLGRAMSMMFTFFLVVSPYIYVYASEAYTNFPFTAYYALGTLCIYQFVQFERKDYFWIGTLLLGGSYWIRPEAGIFIWAIFVLLLIDCLLKRKYMWYPGILLGVFFLIGKPWEWYFNNYLADFLTNSGNYIETQYSFSPGSYKEDILTTAERAETAYGLENILFVIDYFSKAFVEAFGVLNIYVLVVVFFANIKDTFRVNFRMCIVFFAHIGGFFVGTFIFSYYFTNFTSILGSASRLMMTFIPLMIFYIATTALFTEKINPYFSFKKD